MGKMRLPFIDSDLLYRGALSGRFDCILQSGWLIHLEQHWLYLITWVDIVTSPTNSNSPMK